MIDMHVRKHLAGVNGPLTLDCQLHIHAGEFAALFGESGAGKTTLLRMLAGLNTPDEGRIEVDGTVWFDSLQKINLPPQQRRIGYVFQDQALFPHLSVRDNLAVALPKHAAAANIDELLMLTGLTNLQQRRPDTLSGGQRQRVALARALARQPTVLLLDEPLSALDSDTRLNLQDEIRRLHKALGITAVMVSHDLPEVFKLADKVFVLENGSVQRHGIPSSVFADRQRSGHIQVPAEVLEKYTDGITHAVTVLVGTQIIRIIAGDEAVDLRIGDRIMLQPKSFSPMLSKLH